MSPSTSRSWTRTAFADGVMFDGSSIAGLEGHQRIRHDADAGPPRPPASIRSFRRPRSRSCATFSSPRPASPMRATRAASPRRRRPISSPPASAIRSSSVPRPSSSCSTTCASRPTPTTPASSSIRSNCPRTRDTVYEGGNLGHRIRTKGGYFPVPPLDSAQGHAWRDAGRHGLDGPSRSRSTTTRWPPPSTNSA